MEIDSRDRFRGTPNLADWTLDVDSCRREAIL